MQLVLPNWFLLHKLHQEVAWESLADRRKAHRLILMYKMVHQMSPSYLSSLVPSLVGALSHYNLRNANQLSSVPSRTRLYSESFLPSTVRDWNGLPDVVKTISSINCFKKALKGTV